MCHILLRAAENENSGRGPAVGLGSGCGEYKYSTELGVLGKVKFV